MAALTFDTSTKVSSENFEGLVRKGHGSTFGVMVGGFEYTFFQITENDADLGFLAEYHRDGRDLTNTPSTGLDNDLFVGTQFAISDMDDTQTLAGVITDLGDDTLQICVEAERRVGDNLRIEAEAQTLTSVNAENELSAFKSDSFIKVCGSRFF